MYVDARPSKTAAERAAEFEGVVVLGCEAAVETVRASIGSSDCRVIQGMATEGIMNVVPAVSFPFNVSLKMQGITPVEMGSPERLQESRTPMFMPRV